MASRKKQDAPEQPQEPQEQAPAEGNGDTNKPVKVISYYVGRDTYIQASIWQREVQNGESTFLVYDVSLRKRMKVGAEWKSYFSFRGSELPYVLRCVQKAEDWVLETRKKDETPF